MAGFRFRLSTLLRLREANRTERRTQLAEAFRAEQSLRQHLDALEQELASLRNQYRATGTGALDVDRLIDGQRYELLLEAERQVARAHGEALSGEIDRRREALLVADREVRTLEKLRESQAQRHHEEEQRQATKELDELSSRNYSRELES